MITRPIRFLNIFGCKTRETRLPSRKGTETASSRQRTRFWWFAWSETGMMYLLHVEEWDFCPLLKVWQSFNDSSPVERRDKTFRFGHFSGADRWAMKDRLQFTQSRRIGEPSTWKVKTRCELGRWDEIELKSTTANGPQMISAMNDALRRKVNQKQIFYYTTWLAPRHILIYPR